MATYVLKRLVAMVPVLLLVSIVIFSLLHLTPGDPVVVMLGEEATPESRDALRRELGLDRPLPIQYGVWLGRVLQGDLGRSIRTHQPVSEAILQRLPVTLELSLLAMVVSLAIALPAGIVAAVRRNSNADLLSTVFSLLGVSMPNFLLAVLLIYVLSLQLRWLPPIGYVNPFEDLGANLKAMIMPSITLGFALAAVITRQTRGALLEVLHQDYVRTARAKGLPRARVLGKHALRNALIPIVTLLGLSVPALLAGAVITETIFAWPGVGRLLIQSISFRDYPMVQGCILFISVVYVVMNLLTDLAYGWLDPRIRYQ